MAYCDSCGNFDDTYDGILKDKKEGLPDDSLYFYWDGDFMEEDYDWRDAFPDIDCMCEICFDIANEEGKLKWVCQ